ncbi:MAG: sialate O-acetylesterase, partial [Bacteroidales bacterium]|nr:sialate O-acetylesterase [Bacteroidales bacterium]
GLIFTAWGGTDVEAWMSNEYVSKFPELANTSGALDPEKFYQSAVDKDKAAREKYLKSIGFEVNNQSPEWANTPAEGQDWIDVPVPSEWSKTKIGDYQGLVDYQVTFEVPKKWLKKAVIVELGAIDEMDMVWVNGKLIGKHTNPSDWPTLRKYEVPAGTLIKGDNILSVSVANTGGLGGINGKAADMKIRLKGSETESLPLAGTWKARKGQPIGTVEPVEWCQYCSYPNTPTMLYNAMIKPLIPFAIKGAIWYQGESNRFNGMLYRSLFPAMIENWRHDWNQGPFPFYYVQIAPYTYGDKYSIGILRESQEYAMKKLPNAGMIVTMDIGNLKNIHPANKADVGKRLAAWALAKNYGFVNMPYSGPMYQSMQPAGDKIIIHFNFVYAGLTSFGEELKHFEIAGSDRVFKPANARIDGQSIIVSSEEVKEPVAVRFGWHNTDVTNLYNVVGLPAAPFRTDNWEVK